MGKNAGNDIVVTVLGEREIHVGKHQKHQKHQILFEIEINLNRNSSQKKSEEFRIRGILGIGRGQGSN